MALCWRRHRETLVAASTPVETWASDVPISMPEPVKDASTAIPMEGFVFTTSGLSHGVTDADIEEMKHPAYGPERLGDV